MNWWDEYQYRQRCEENEREIRSMQRQDMDEDTINRIMNPLEVNHGKSKTKTR